MSNYEQWCEKHCITQTKKVLFEKWMSTSVDDLHSDITSMSDHIYDGLYMAYLNTLKRDLTQEQHENC